MTKQEIVNKIVEKTGVPKVDVLVTVEAFMKEVKSSLEAGEPVFLRGFGTFGTKVRRAKLGRNIKAGVPVEIPERVVPTFKPAKEFSLAVKDQEVPA